MKTDIKVSVIIPIYNGEIYVKEALRQIRNQTLKEIEIICVDDGSKDLTVEMLREEAEQDSRIKVVETVHETAGAARNKGMELASGKYLSFMDVDDFFEPNMLESAYERAERTEADVVVYRADQFDSKQGYFTESNWTVKEDRLPEKKTFSHKDIENFYYCFSGFPWDKMFRSSFIKELDICFQNQACINDQFFVYSSLVAAEKISFINEILVHKRIHNPGSISEGYIHKEESEYCFFNALRAIRVQLIAWNMYKEMERDYLNYAVQYSLWNLNRFIPSNRFNMLYDRVKEEYFRALGLYEMKPDMFYEDDKRREFSLVLSMDSREYRWQKILTRKENTFLFPFGLVPHKAKVIIYGAGAVGISFYRQIAYSAYCDIVAWVDKKWEEKGAPVESLQALNEREYDFVVIAIHDAGIAKKITTALMKENVPSYKIIWKNPELQLEQRNV